MNDKYWIWLSLVLGYDCIKVKKLYEEYSDISDFYNGREFEWRFCGIFTEKEIQRMSSISIDSADRIIAECIELDYKIISIENERYPECLKNIPTPPAVIYVKGYLPRIDNLLTIGIVGTRRASDYGKKVSYSMSYNLAKKGVTIVSGGALGVDSSAHTGALNADGITISVLGCGIDYPYLMKNAQMREAITKKGCIVSEYPPGTEPLSHHFPSRNRILSAFSRGVLVIEAGRHSGSLITAKMANEQGRDVFAVMGNINNVNSMGSNELIKDGAIPVTTYIDILSYYNEYNNLEVYEDDEYDIPDSKILKIPAKKLQKNSVKKFISEGMHNKYSKLSEDENV